MRLLIVVGAAFLAAGRLPAEAQTIQAPFTTAYSFVSLGAAPGVPSSYGGLTFKAGDPNTIIIGGAANGSSGAVYAVTVVRGADRHITGFAGTAARVADAANNDGGVAYGPGGVLFLARWPNNELGQTKTGSGVTDKVISLGALGVSASPGGVNFVPAGYPGQGRLKLASYDPGQWYDATVAGDAGGTFDVVSLRKVLDFPARAEGFSYVPLGSPLVTVPSVLLSEYSAGNLVVYEVDTNGDPVLSTRRIVVSGLSGPEGVTFDPLTGDAIVSSFTQGRVFAIRGFGAPLGIFDPVADFDAGFAAGTNPNGAWSYGWSSTLTSPLHLYSRHHTISPDCGYETWDDPGNNVSFTPGIFKNVGGNCADGNVDIPAQAVTLHFGGASGHDFSHIVFTAPSDGTYAVSWTFTGHQNAVNSDVHILANGHSLLSDLITVDRQTKSFAGSVALLAGQTIDFAVGSGTVIGLHPGHIGISGSIEKIMAPGAPTDLTANKNAGGGVLLAWTADGSSAAAFQIDRRTVAGFVRVATVDGSLRTYTDTRVTPQNVYTYRIRAVNGAGVSAYSNTATVSLLVGKLVVRQRSLVVNVLVGKTATVQLQVRNDGRATLDGVVGTLSAPFSVTSGDGEFALAPGGTLTVTVRFAPTAHGTFTQALTITSAAPGDSPVTVTVTGTAR